MKSPGITCVAIPPWGQVVRVAALSGMLQKFLYHALHKPEQCAGEACALHNPSDHALRDAPMTLRMDREVPLIERQCPHGVGHADPDSVAYFQRDGGHAAVGVHGCDGCCAS